MAQGRPEIGFNTFTGPLSNPNQIIQSGAETKTHIFSFVQRAAPQLEQLRGQDNYLRLLFDTIDSIGGNYATESVKRLDENQFDTAGMIKTIEARNYGSLESSPRSYRTAIKIGRETEAIKRYLLTQEILANGEATSSVEKILLLGSLSLSHQSDIIFFDEWRPIVKDSQIGKELIKMEKREEGSSTAILPGIPSETRWFTREIIDPEKPLAKDNIRLVRYRDSLPTTFEVVKVLATMEALLEQEKKKL